MAYKLPQDLQVDVIVYIDGYGWRSISLTTGMQEHQNPFLDDWSTGDYADEIIANDL